MRKIVNIEAIKFENDKMFLVLDNKTLEFNLEDISDKLFKATMSEKNNYSISPSGYGIHWNLIDEDLSIKNLIKK